MKPSPARVAHRHLQAAGLPKIPGISSGRLKKMFEDLREGIVDSLTEAYDGGEWIASFTVTKGHPDTHNGQDTVFVEDAAFSSVHGERDDIEFYSGSRGFNRTQQEAGLPTIVNRAIAKALSGTFMATAKFPWEEGTRWSWFYGAKKVGDEFSVESDAYERGGPYGPGTHWVEVPVKIKARVSYIKREEVFRIRASFTG